MREITSSDSINGGPPKSRGLGLFAIAIGAAHVVFFFAPNLYLPFDLNELFLLGHGLVIADSGLLVFLGIKLFGVVLRSDKTD